MVSSMPGKVETSIGSDPAQGADHVVDQNLRGRRSGRHADHLGVADPRGIERIAVGDQIARNVAFRTDLPQPVGIRTVVGANHQNNVGDLAEFANGRLSILRRVADVPGFRSDDVGKPRLQGRDDAPGVVDAQRRLGDVGDQCVVSADRAAPRRRRSAPDAPARRSAPSCLRPRDGRRGRPGSRRGPAPR